MISDIAIRLGLAVVSGALSIYAAGGLVVTIDGQRYCSTPRPSPYRLRWLLPALCGQDVRRWAAAAWLSLLAVALLWPGDLWSLAIWCSLPWYRTMATAPVLVDAPALALALAARRAERAWWQLGLGAITGAVSERAPVFGALFSGRPLVAFAGLTAVAAAWRWTHEERGDGQSPWAAGASVSHRITSPVAMLLPWGAGLAAALSPSWQPLELATLAAAYGQLLLARDSSRLYQWASPVVIPRAVAVIPTRWLPVAVLATWCNPFVKVQRFSVVV